MIKGMQEFRDALKSGKPIAVTIVGPGVRRKEELTLDELRDKNWLFYAHIGRRIQVLRAEKRLTVKELAARTKIHESVLQRYEAGKLPISGHAIETIAKALGIRKSEIHPSYDD